MQILIPADLSLLMYRLLDKLLVVCPNGTLCDAVLTRAELERHLKHRHESFSFPHSLCSLFDTVLVDDPFPDQRTLQTIRFNSVILYPNVASAVWARK